MVRLSLEHSAVEFCPSTIKIIDSNLGMIVLTDTEDFSVMLPERLNECELLILLKWQELKEEQGLTKAQFAFAWLRTCLSEESFLLLIKACEPDKVAEWAVDCSEIFLANNEGLTEQKLPLLSLKGLRLVGQASRCPSIRFGQWVEADEQFLLWYKSKNDKHLAKLAAILYRNDREIKYNSSLNAEIAHRLLNEVERPILLLIAEFWAGCRALFEARFKRVFPKVLEGEATKPKELKYADIQQMVLAYHEKLVQYAKTPDRKMAMYQENAWTVFEFIEYDLKVYEQMKNAPNP
jgi:hypothetical protein